MKEIKVNFSEEDLQEMLFKDREFHWEFEGVKLHLFKGEEE